MENVSNDHALFSQKLCFFSFSLSRRPYLPHHYKILDPPLVQDPKSSDSGIILVLTTDFPIIWYRF